MKHQTKPRTNGQLNQQFDHELANGQVTPQLPATPQQMFALQQQQVQMEMQKSMLTWMSTVKTTDIQAFMQQIQASTEATLPLGMSGVGDAAGSFYERWRLEFEEK